VLGAAAHSMVLGGQAVITKTDAHMVRRGRAGRGLPRPEPGAGSAGPGAAQRRRLILVRHDSATDRVGNVCCPGSPPCWQPCWHSSVLRRPGRDCGRSRQAQRPVAPIRCPPCSRWPLRPEAKLRRGLPAPQHVWPATDRPRVSADVHRWPWRLSLTSSLSRLLA